MAYASSYTIMMVYLHELVQNCYGCIYIAFVIEMIMEYDGSIYAHFFTIYTHEMIMMDVFYVLI